MDRFQLEEERYKIYQSLGDLVYAGIHDLKSPVANLKLIARLLSTVKDINEVSEYANMISEAVKQVETSINGLAKVMDIQSNDCTVIEQINFDEIIDQLKKKYPGIKLNVSFKSAPTIIHIAPYIKTILNQLLSNTLYYADERGAQLELSTQYEQGYTLLKARDYGIGFNYKKYGQKVFRPFTRITKKSDGAGLGLYLIKIIVEKNGGKVHIQSEPGIGTMLNVYLKEYKKTNSIEDSL